MQVDTSQEGHHYFQLAADNTTVRTHPNRPHMAGEGEVLQSPKAASIWYRSAAQPLGWVQGRSALPGELFINSIVGQYCVSFGWAN
jgi:hypothetical protein